MSNAQGSTLESVSKDYEKVCAESKNYMKMAIDCMNEKDEEVKKRASKVLEEGIKVVDSYAKRHKHTENSSPPPPPSLQQQKQKADVLKFIAQYQKEHEGSAIDWCDCYTKGKEEGLFDQYQDGKSLKAPYYRLKKQQQQQKQ